MVNIELTEKEGTRIVEIIKNHKATSIVDIRLADRIEKAIEGGTIKIMTNSGLVLDVEGMPEGYQYEIIECDKCGNPLPPEDLE